MGDRCGRFIYFHLEDRAAGEDQRAVLVVRLAVAKDRVTRQFDAETRAAAAGRWVESAGTCESFRCTFSIAHPTTSTTTSTTISATTSTTSIAILNNSFDFDYTTRAVDEAAVEAQPA